MIQCEHCSNWYVSFHQHACEITTLTLALLPRFSCFPLAARLLLCFPLFRFHFSCVGLTEQSAASIEAYSCDMCEQMGMGTTRRESLACLTCAGSLVRSRSLSSARHLCDVCVPGGVSLHSLAREATPSCRRRPRLRVYSSLRSPKGQYSCCAHAATEPSAGSASRARPPTPPSLSPPGRSACPFWCSVPFPPSRTCKPPVHLVTSPVSSTLR